MNSIWLLLYLQNYVESFKKPVFISGATSDVGQKVVEHFASQNIRTRCLVRDSSVMERFVDDPNVELVQGNVLEIDTLTHIMSGCSSSINLHGSIRKSTPWKSHLDDKTHPYHVNYVGMNNIIESCRINNISRIIRLTGLATAFPLYHPIPLIFDIAFSRNVYWHRKAEESLEKSGLDYTIFRPGGIRDVEYKSVEIQPNYVSPPALIDANNLAKVIVASVIPNSSIFETSLDFKNTYIALRGIGKV